jgi:hypothetical protein
MSDHWAAEKADVTEGSITAATRHLHERVESLQKAVHGLGERLEQGGLLRPAMAEPTDGLMKEVVPKLTSEVAGEISRASAKISAEENTLADLRNRLDV